MPQYPLLRTKLHIPPVRFDLVPRPHLIERLNAGLPGQGAGPWYNPAPAWSPINPPDHTFG
jgi:hypothetical protein